MNRPNPVDIAGKALGGMLITIGWLVGLFLLFKQPPLLSTVSIVLMAVEMIFYIVGGVIFFIFSEE